MRVTPDNVKALAKAKCDENYDFRIFIKGTDDPGDLDRFVADLSKRVWARIDCTACANCCKFVRPLLEEEDIAPLAAALGMTPSQFIAAHLEKARGVEETEWRMKTLPCPLLKDNKCIAYDQRPQNCRGYPFLYEPAFISRTLGMIERTFTCPIVYEVMEALKPAMGFRGKVKRG